MMHLKKIKGRLGYEGTDDALKIPQYYYDEHGKYEYTMLIQKVFKYKELLYTSPIIFKIK